jgi:hypothetical protein
MPEQASFHTSYNYQGISEMARSLARTLQAAPAQESRRAAALRQYLIGIANKLAEASDHCGNQTEALSSHHHASCRFLVEQIRKMTAELTSAPPVVPPGIGVVVAAFTEMLLPDALLVLRPTARGDYAATDYMKRLRELSEEAQLSYGQEPAEPLRYCLSLRYPEGEQDNVLLSCVLIHAVGRILRVEGQRFNADEFATGLLGPAYFFATAAEFEYFRMFDSYKAINLYWIVHALEQVGWFEHPQIGPLLHTWRERVNPDRLLTAETRTKFEAAKSDVPWQERFPNWRLYTPADFDQDVPRLWERLRQLVPPNDLDISAVESAQPADAVSILNAGWSFYLLHIDDLYHILGSKTAEDRYEAKQVLNRLLTKGIELSQIARRWKEAREES